MPQVVAAWCRRRGHEVHYATYWGQRAPERLLPDDLDVVFIAAFTEASALAYVVARLLARRGSFTVLGGPHARAFPHDAARFFDCVVGECDEALIGDIADGVPGVEGNISAAGKVVSIPLLAERAADVRTASFHRGYRSRFSLIPLLSSTGCPYDCDFCVDWNSAYRLRAAGDLEADLAFAAEAFPGQLIAFSDPNFTVSFDRTLASFDRLPPEKRNPLIVETSLSILKPGRIERLRAANCAYIAPGVESWGAYGKKAGTGTSGPRDKFERVAEHLALVARHIPGVQANFMFGTDSDSGREPVDLTIAFIRRFPDIFPGLGAPIAFGGTPMRERLRQEGRLLPLPPVYYFGTLPTLIPKHYEPEAFLRQLVEILRSVLEPASLGRRLRASLPFPVRVAHLLRCLQVDRYVRSLQAMLAALGKDPAVLSFNEGRRTAIPVYYDQLLDRRLGRYAALLSRADRQFVSAD
jgi:hypothetical protein